MSGIISSIEILKEKDEKKNLNVVEVGETITVKAKLTDDKSGVQSSYIVIKNPSGSRLQIVYLKQNNASNLWEGSYTIRPTDEGGVYKDFSIHITDNAGNSTQFMDLKDFKDKMMFTVNNSNGDIKAPILSDIDITPKIVNVGETITVKAKLTDDKSGVQSSYIVIKNPSGSRLQIIYLKLNNISNLWEGAYTIKQTDEGGVYDEFNINMTDNAGNSTQFMDLKDFKDKVMFTVNNSNGDIKAPILSDIDITPKIVNVGETITVKAKLIDDKSGVQSSYIVIKNPSSSRLQIVYLKLNNVSNLWEGAYTIKQTDEGGIYKDFNINMTDNAGNSTQFMDLKEFLDKIIFTVNNNNGDIKPPEVKQIKIEEDKK